MEKMGEGMRIHISLASKELLDRVMLTIQKAFKKESEEKQRLVDAEKKATAAVKTMGKKVQSD